MNDRPWQWIIGQWDGFSVDLEKIRLDMQDDACEVIRSDWVHTRHAYP